MKENEFEKPRLVPTGQGFSVLNTVEYRGRFLYSKYSPDRAITESVKKLTVLPGTIVLICSPCLWYGFEELKAMSGNQCLFVALEEDQNLLELSESTLSQKSISKEELFLFNLNDLPSLDSFIRKQANTGKYRRILKIDFSAGVQFNKQLYDFTASGIQEIIERFWKNRITLSRFGRLYSKNLFKNLPTLSQSLQLSQIASSIHKPILVLGAGESIDQFFSFAAEEKLLSVIKECFFTIVVDAALPCVLERHFIPDAVVLVESQFAITKAFIVNRQLLKDTVLFCDICSRPSISRKDFGFGATVFFASAYSEASFLEQLKSQKIILEYIKGLGSVGLVAVEVAKTLAADENVPVVFSGMDFSYTAGITHAKNAPAHKARLCRTDRLFNIQNIDAAFSGSALTVQGKGGKTMCTTPVLKSYGELFSKLNSQSTSRIFDLAAFGIPTGATQLPLEALKDFVLSMQNTVQNDSEKKFTQWLKEKSALQTASTSEADNAVIQFTKKEKQALLTIRDLLVNGENSCKRNKAMSLEEQLKELLLPREYLYLHFPDGHCLSMEPQFLKRVRPEVDVFLKILN